MSSIRIVTLNTWQKEGPYDARVRLIRDWLEKLQPDLIGFQEVMEDELAELLDGFDYRREWYSGLSIASRWPIGHFTTMDLPGIGQEEAAGPVLAGHIDSPFGAIPFVNATTFYFLPHDGWKRRKQMPSLAAFVRSIRIRGGYPLVMVGDFNTVPDSDEIRYLKGLHAIDDTSVYFADAWDVAGDGGNGATWTQTNDYSKEYGLPDRRIDYIFVAGPGIKGPGSVLSCRVVCNESVDGVWPSDHFGVYAELSA